MGNKVSYSRLKNELKEYQADGAIQRVVSGPWRKGIVLLKWDNVHFLAEDEGVILWLISATWGRLQADDLVELAKRLTISIRGVILPQWHFFTN